MNWQAVIEKLRWFASNANESASAMLMSNQHFYAPDMAQISRLREKADLYLTLAAALEAGITK